MVSIGNWMGPVFSMVKSLILTKMEKAKLRKCFVFTSAYCNWKRSQMKRLLGVVMAAPVTHCFHPSGSRTNYSVAKIVV